MKRKSAIISLLIVILLFASACGSSAPSGFSKTESYKEQGVSVTTYTGKGSSSDAVDDFVKWAKKSGWTESKDASGLSSLGFSGTILENKKEMMVIQAYDIAGQVTVIVAIGPKE